MPNDTYNSPFNARYASKEMQYIYSPDFKFKTWRKLWIALAEAEKELGLDITQEQIDELKANADNINYDVAREYEKKFRHDVMSHVHAYGEQCPKAKPIIHLGATSCYVGDNTDVITMREALLLIKKKLVNAIASVSKFADEYKDMPCLGFTHFQPAQPTTVGKRATLWLMDLVMDYEEICHVIDSLMLLGSKGTTGTQASFLELFDGDHNKALDQACADACLNAQPLPNSQLGQNLAKPGWNCHHDNFKDSNPNVEWKATLEQAEKIGMGTRQYTLKKI